MPLTDEELICPEWYVFDEYSTIERYFMNTRLDRFDLDILKTICGIDYPEYATMREILSIKSAKIQQKLNWNSLFVSKTEQRRAQMLASRAWDGVLRCCVGINYDAKPSSSQWIRSPLEKVRSYSFFESREKMFLESAAIIIMFVLAWIFGNNALPKNEVQ